MKTCNKCAVRKYNDEFYSRGGQCKVCVRARVKANSDLNREAKAQYAVDYREKNPNKIKVYRAANHDKHLAYMKEYRTTNHCSYLAYNAKRRAVTKRTTPTWYNKTEVDAIYALARERGLVVDHMVPLNSPLVCGLNVQDNLRAISQTLNACKGNRYWPDMAGAA